MYNVFVKSFIRGVDMLTKEIIYELWKRTDEYIEFSLNDSYKNFSSRLAKWRQLNGLTKKEMAALIYEQREYMGLEQDSDLRETRITSLSRSYSSMEKDDSGYNNNSSAISINNFRILKYLLHCDYDFLLCEIDTPHKYSKELSKSTGLTIKTIEKLFMLGATYEGFNESIFSSRLKWVLNQMIADDDLMLYLSYYLGISSEYFKDSVNLNLPLAGLMSEDSFLDSTTLTLSHAQLIEIYRYTLARKFINLREKHSDYFLYYSPQNNEITYSNLVSEHASFGERLKALRNSKDLTQEDVTSLIINYRVENNIIQPIENDSPLEYIVYKSTLRSYQNWESKKNGFDEIRLCIQDIKMLKNIFNCDYDYLFGDINYPQNGSSANYKSLGLTKANMEKLIKYNSVVSDDDAIANRVPLYRKQFISALNLMISDNRFLEYLAYFMTDLPCTMDGTDILKPLVVPDMYEPPMYGQYRKKLFNEKTELRNIFLPLMFDRLAILRKQYQDRFSDLSEEYLSYIRKTYLEKKPVD